MQHDPALKAADREHGGQRYPLLIFNSGDDVIIRVL
jgi:hypothetical protein